MRELKFRIWVKDEERFYDESDEESYQIVPNGNVTYTSEAYEENGAWFTDTTSATDDVIVEQYTGLKDKNGKEIYEGDIVKAGGRIYEVAWFEKDGGWFCFRENDSVYMPLYHLKGEVIGNIHENSEPIKEEE